MNKALICSLLILILPPGSAAPLDEITFDTISISADEANEDELPGILHFDGNFLMQSSDWQLASKKATVYGNPNKPDRVYLEGSPALFLVHRTGDVTQGPVEASASVVEYQRTANTLTLSGGAILRLDDEVIRSTIIEYDIGTRRYRAGGIDGVLIEVPPVD